MQGVRARWVLQDPIADEVRRELGGRSVMLSHLLWCRGYRSADAILHFFTQRTIDHDPLSLPDIAPAVERLVQAIRTREQLAVYGDFDCDGLTATAVLVHTLRAYGIEPRVHIPNREDGHGLNPAALARLHDEGVSLILTADCGITAHSEVLVARGMGMDVIITDHHEARPDLSLPECPTISPTRFDSEYPCRFLCGVGVAYKLVQALTRRLPCPFDPDDLLDLVALGTVADVVPLRDENRSLVLRGLDALRRTSRPGLLALFKAAGVERDQIDPISIGFYLAPRINAANRMATPQLAYDLIMATDGQAAADLAVQLSAYNTDRQALVNQCFDLLCAEIGDPDTLSAAVRSGVHPPLLITLGSWNAGISGLLASRLVDLYGLPAFVGTDSGTGMISASGRGIPGSRLDELLEAVEAAVPGGIFENYGGHAAAGGFRVQADRFAEARALLEAEARTRIPLEGEGPSLLIDAEVHLSQLTLDAARLVHSLAPYGMDFPEPVFLVRDAVLLAPRAIGGGKHTRFTLQQNGAGIQGIAFRTPPEFSSLPPGTRLDAVFHLQVNEWNGRQKPEISLRDWRVLS